jgi:hypothetical protein
LRVLLAARHGACAAKVSAINQLKALIVGAPEELRATLESARSIDRPSMGLLRRPTTSGIVEGGRLGRPCGPGAHSRAI